MALHLHYSQICRFCLSQDWHNLVPLSTIMNSTLTPEDVERFTGIENLEEDHGSYVLCRDCHIKLINAVTFRHSCLANEAFFREFCPKVEELVESCDETDKISVLEPIERVSEIEIVIVDKPKRRKAREIKQEDAIERTPCAFVKEEEIVEFDYCANRIEPGELYSSDGEDDETVPAKHLGNPVTLDKDALFAESMRLIRAAQEQQQQQQEEIRTNESSGCESSSNNTLLLREKLSKGNRSQLCDVCGKVVQKISDHMTTHTKELRYACPHCPVRMANHGNLYRHVQAVHLKKVIKSCEVCGKGFTSKGSYKSHMRSEHDIGETYSCKLCPKTFNHPGNYRIHNLRCHSDERKFACSTCGKQFKERRDHRNHQRVHSNEKPFTCSQCPKGFKSEYARKTHELTHSGVIFQCTSCDKSYRYKCLLSIHIKKDHPELSVSAADVNDGL
ncbi:zinc finger protein 239-like [Anopheles maculipalpis]|uniref:zinc finger protein 239-like n=1 Tax=Anopheles maculipalpis TaxID=1496333 RepID=UPI002158CD6F|nr:zinc finger protein 239-like [Anopheles maculipalpis]